MVRGWEEDGLWKHKLSQSWGAGLREGREVETWTGRNVRKVKGGGQRRSGRLRNKREYS